MCGINLIWSRERKDLKASILEMNDGLHHRGPDRSSFHCMNLQSGSMALGSTQLQVFKDEEGEQPCIDEDESYCLVFNGFVSNYLELANSYFPGRGFNSDTALLFELLKLLGQKGVSLLNGMFSLAFVNKKENHFFITRDGQGIKPLYYFKSPDILIVSSEARPINKLRGQGVSFNSSALAHYIWYRYPKPSFTWRNDIFELSPKEVLSNNGGQFETSAFEIEHKNKKNEQLDRVLKKAVARNMKSDVPIALLLSGGIDSSLLLQYLHELGHENITCYCFGEEAANAKELTKKLGVKLVVVPENEFSEKNIQEYIRNCDFPVADPAAVLTSVLCKKIKEDGFSVVLSGAGADEVFAGYNRHKAYSFLKSSSIPIPLLRLGVFLFSFFNKSKTSALRRVLRSTNSNDFESFTALNGDYSSIDRPRNKAVVQSLLQALSFDKKNYLVYDVLKISDQSAMMHGVELRVPFLDNEVTHLVGQYSEGELLKKGTKTPLRDLLEDKGLSFINKRRKKGFGIDLPSFLRRDSSFIHEKLWSVNSKLWEYLPYNECVVIRDKHLKGEEDYSREIWSLFLISEWLHNEE